MNFINFIKWLKFYFLNKIIVDVLKCIFSDKNLRCSSKNMKLKRMKIKTKKKIMRKKKELIRGYIVMYSKDNKIIINNHDCVDQLVNEYHRFLISF